jgi:hypothetical protein
MQVKLSAWRADAVAWNAVGGESQTCRQRKVMEERFTQA